MRDVAFLHVIAEVIKLGFKADRSDNTCIAIFQDIKVNTRKIENNAIN